MLTYNILMLTCDLFMSTCKMLIRKIIQVACKNSYLAQWHHYVPFDLAIKPRLTRRIKAYGVVLQTGVGNTTEWWRSVQTSLFLFYFLGICLLFYKLILFKITRISHPQTPCYVNNTTINKNAHKIYCHIVDFELYWMGVHSKFSIWKYQKTRFETKKSRLNRVVINLALWYAFWTFFIDGGIVHVAQRLCSICQFMKKLI